MSEPALPFERNGDGLELRVRLTPNSKRRAIDGIVHDAAGVAWLGMRVDAPPVDGKANRSLIAALAELLDCRASCMAIVAGETGRFKRLRITRDVDHVAAGLRAHLRHRAT